MSMSSRIRVVLACASLAVASGCAREPLEEVATEGPATVTTLTLAPQPVEHVVTASGVVAAAPGADWTITAPEPARIVDLPKAEGDPVKPGDLLVRFEIPALQTDVATRAAEKQSAQARVENAQANVTRLATLVEHGVAAQKELEDARRELAEAKATLGQAQAAHQNATVLESRTVVRARFPGVVAKRMHNPGDMVEAAASDVILRIIDPARLQVVAAVPAADLARVHAGQAARIVVPGLPDPVAGRVLSRPVAVDQNGVAGDVRVAFDAPTALAAGLPVRVEIVAERREGALAVPTSALVREDDDVFVMVAGPDGKAHKRAVSIGLATPSLSEVTAGLKAGDAVIVQGQQELPDNAPIARSK
jgi:cobalt-zinc-cadmium efflux system membrane fusion protein